MGACLIWACEEENLESMMSPMLVSLLIGYCLIGLVLHFNVKKDGGVLAAPHPSKMGAAAGTKVLLNEQGKAPKTYLIPLIHRIMTVVTVLLRYTFSLKNSFMSILTWILLGLVAGAIAKYIHPGKDPGGWIMTIVIGIVGAVVGGFIANALGLAAASGFDLWSIIVAVFGAVICLFAYRKLA